MLAEMAVHGRLHPAEVYLEAALKKDGHYLHISLRYCYKVQAAPDVYVTFFLMSITIV